VEAWVSLLFFFSARFHSRPKRKFLKMIHCHQRLSYRVFVTKPIIVLQNIAFGREELALEIFVKPNWLSERHNASWGT
jgi:hypothetical protein